MNPLKSFANSMSDFVKSGFELAPDEEQSKRMAICEACDQYSAGVCMQCLCVMKLKTKIASVVCPLGKWPAIVSGVPQQVIQPVVPSNDKPVVSPTFVKPGGCGCTNK